MDLTAAPPRAFEHLVLDFLAYLEFERGLSRNTLEAYRADLLQFGAYLHTGIRRPRRRPCRAGGFSHRARKRIASARRSPRQRSRARPPACAPSTAICAVEGRSRTTRPPSCTARARRRGCRRCSPRQVDRLLRSRRAPRGGATRQRATGALYACGLRASEAVGLTLADIDLEEAMLRARGRAQRSGSCRSGAGVAAARPTLSAAPGRWSAWAGRSLRQPSRRRAHQAGPLQDRSGHARTVGPEER